MQYIYINIYIYTDASLTQVNSVNNCFKFYVSKHFLCTKHWVANT